MNKRRKVLDRDEGNLVKTNTWTPLFTKLTEKEANTKTWRQIQKRCSRAPCVSITFENDFD